MRVCKKSIPFDHILPHLVPFGPFGHVRPCKAFFCPIWPRLTLLGTIWHPLAPFGTIWPRLDPFGPKMRLTMEFDSGVGPTCYCVLSVTLPNLALFSNLSSSFKLFPGLSRYLNSFLVLSSPFKFFHVLPSHLKSF